jgi:hypothetical protein
MLNDRKGSVLARRKHRRLVSAIRKGKSVLKAGQDILDGFRALMLPRGGGEAPRQQRRLTRLHSLYRVAVGVDGKEMKATVVDMGLEGMKLEVPFRIQPGKEVDVRWLGASASAAARRFDLDSIRARVMWCRKKRFLSVIEIGVAYADTESNMERSWVKYILRQVGFEIQSILDRRKSVRLQALLRADVKSGATQALPGMVINMGAGGVLFESASRVGPGSTVFLEIGPSFEHDMLICRGIVVEARQAENGWHLGIRFEDLQPRQATLVTGYVKSLMQEATTLQEGGE